MNRFKENYDIFWDGIMPGKQKLFSFASITWCWNSTFHDFSNIIGQFYLWTCLYFANCVSLSLKLHNQYCHNILGSELFLSFQVWLSKLVNSVFVCNLGVVPWTKVIICKLCRELFLLNRIWNLYVLRSLKSKWHFF